MLKSSIFSICEGLDQNAIDLVDLPCLASDIMRVTRSPWGSCLGTRSLCSVVTTGTTTRTEPLPGGHVSQPCACQVGFVVTAIAEKHDKGIRRQAADHAYGVACVCCNN